MKNEYPETEKFNAWIQSESPENNNKTPITSFVRGNSDAQELLCGHLNKAILNGDDKRETN